MTLGGGITGVGWCMVHDHMEVLHGRPLFKLEQDLACLESQSGSDRGENNCLSFICLLFNEKDAIVVAQNKFSSRNLGRYGPLRVLIMCQNYRCVRIIDVSEL